MKIEIYTHANCGACRADKPLHTLLAKTYPVTFVDPTTDEGAEHANMRDIRACPAIAILNNHDELRYVSIGKARQEDVFAAIGEVIAEDKDDALDIPLF